MVTSKVERGISQAITPIIYKINTQKEISIAIPKIHPISEKVIHFVY